MVKHLEEDFVILVAGNGCGISLVAGHRSLESGRLIGG